MINDMVRAGEWLRTTRVLRFGMHDSRIPQQTLLRAVADSQGTTVLTEFYLEGRHWTQVFTHGFIRRSHPTEQEEYDWCLLRLA